MQLTDTHCHLDLSHFDEDREAVIERARAIGVQRILVPGLDIPSSRAALALAESHDLIYAAVGVHPNSARTWNSGSKVELKDLAAHPRVVAIGEIGLDYYWEKATPDEQKLALAPQLELAAELELPVILHNREAGHDLIPLMQAWRNGLLQGGNALAHRPGVFHSFSGSNTDAQDILSADFYLGFTGPLTFKNAPELREVARQLPLDRILIETDAPFLTPHPHRGKRNEPGMVRFTAEKLADLHGLTPDALADRTFANSVELFGW